LGCYKYFVMLIAAFVILGIAVLLGAVLAVLYLRTDGAARPRWTLAALHGLVAIAGLGCLVLALRGPPRGLDQGAGSFGIIAAALIALAAMLGAGFLAARFCKMPIAGILIGIHATLAVSGFVVLAVYVQAR
jgi:hypothetical protein